MRVWVIARGHAPPAFESANAPFTALRAGYRSGAWGWEFVCRVRAGMPAFIGLHALPRQLGAQGVDVIGPVRDQARPRRVRPGSHQGPSLGVVAARAARHAQAQRAALSIRQDQENRGQGCGSINEAAFPNRRALIVQA